MNLFFLTTTFPPRSSSNSIRTAHFAKFLKKQGNSISVITYKKKYLSMLYGEDSFLLKKTSGIDKIEELEIGMLRRRIYNNSRKANGGNLKEKNKNNLLTSLIFPDPHVDAILKFYNKAKFCILNNEIDVLVTFAYPYTMHLVGYLLKRKFPTLIWVADYGDPWTDCPATELYLPHWRKKFDKIVETFLLDKTDLITVTTENTKKLYSKNFPRQKNKINVVPMGYDPDDFKNIKSRAKQNTNKISFIHTGRLYSDARDPNPVINGCYRLLMENPEIKNLMEILFIGEIDKETKDLISNPDINNLITYIPWVTMDESIQWMKSADYLLLFGNYGAIQIPGKLFQYIGSKRPIILLYETEDDPVIPILKDIDNALIVKNDVCHVKEMLEKILNGEITHHKKHISAPSSQYSWETICTALDSHLKELVLRKTINKPNIKD